MNIHDGILNRRSTRNFSDKPVSKETISELIESAIYAPSSCNMQAWNFIIVHCNNNLKTTYLFESSWKKKYTDRGIRKILEKYSAQAGLKTFISPHKLRHFLFTWLKKQGIDDALIQPYSGHESRKNLEIYSKLSIAEAQEAYDEVINNFPI